MKNLLILVLFGCLASTFAVFSPYIIDGEGVGPKDAPHTVAIFLNRPQNPGFCGGVLISRNYVLTAASCLVGVPRVSVYLGASNINKPDDIIDVTDSKNLIPHPMYNAAQDRNDIGLIKLSRPAVLTDTVQVVQLPKWSQRKKSFSGVTVQTAGWGTRGKRGEKFPVEQLQIVKEEVISNLGCKSKYPSYITSSNICTGHAGTPCDGDEGDAMYMNEEGKPTAIGVFSYQFSLGCTWGWPPVYARITSFLEWIQSNSDVIIRD